SCRDQARPKRASVFHPRTSRLDKPGPQSSRPGDLHSAQRFLRPLTPEKPGMRYVVGLMLLVFSLPRVWVGAAGLRGLWMTWRRRPFLKSAVGRIVSLRKHVSVSDEDGSTIVNLPVVRFTTESGEVKQFASQIGSAADNSKYRVFDTLPVLYDPDHVLPPKIDSWITLCAGHLLFVML